MWTYEWKLPDASSGMRYLYRVGVRVIVRPLCSYLIAITTASYIIFKITAIAIFMARKSN